MQERKDCRCAQILSQCRESRLFRLYNNERDRLESGLVRLAFLEELRVYFLSIGSWCQLVTPNIPIVYCAKNTGTTFFFPSTEKGVLALFIPICEQSRLTVFTEKLGKLAQLVPWENAATVPLFNNLMLFHAKDLQEKPISEDTTAFDLGHKGIAAIKSGVAWVGDKLKEGAAKTEEFLKGENLTADQERLKREREEEARCRFCVNNEQLAQLFNPTYDWSKELADLNVRSTDAQFKVQDRENVQQQVWLECNRFNLPCWAKTSEGFKGLSEQLSQVADNLGGNSRFDVENFYRGEQAQWRDQFRLSEEQNRLQNQFQGQVINH